MSDAALTALEAVATEDPRMLVARALQAARDVLDMEVAYLAALDDAEQVFRAVDPAGLVPGITTARRIPRGQSYCDRLIAGVIPACVPDTRAHPETVDLLLTQNGIRAYVGVVIERRDGTAEGTLCCLSRSPDPAVAEREVRFMRVLARLIGDQLERQDAQRRRERRREGLAAMAMHDLRAPVTAVRGYAELLDDSDPPLSEQQHGFVGRILAAAEQLTSLSDHLLDITRAGGEAPRAPHEEVDLSAVLQEAVGLLEPSAADAGVRLSVATGDGLTVRGDRAGLLRVFENLVGNAVKYTPGGGTVDVRAERDGDGLVVTVADTGCGIPDDEQDQVFEPFYRAAAGIAVARGSGLGLAVCRKIVEEHGGSLHLESNEGGGTIVSVALLAYPAGPS